MATGLYNPIAIACDSAGNLFVVCSDVGKVLRISADGGQSVFVSNLDGPCGLAIDRLGNLFVGAHDSTGEGVILKVTADGTETNFASGVGKPTGLAFDAAGNLYASDRESATIFKFAPDGTKMVFAAGFTLEAVKFPSPDRKFALLIDKQGKPAIIEQQSRKPVLALDAVREDEDRMIWSADSKWFAFSHRGNKETDLNVYYWNGDSFQKATLPDLPEPAIQERPNKKSLSEQIHHFDFERTEPLRWLKSGVLVVSHSLGFTNNTLQSISYSREYTITISFDAKHIGHIKNVTKQPQKVEEGNG